MSRRVVVTGVGAVTPLGIGADTLHAAAVRGESGIVDASGGAQSSRGRRC